MARPYFDRGDYGNYVLYFNSGVPAEIMTKNSPVDPRVQSRLPRALRQGQLDYRAPGHAESRRPLRA